VFLTVDGVCDNTTTYCTNYPTDAVCYCNMNPTDPKCTNGCPITSIGTSNCSLSLYCRKNITDPACKCIINPTSCSNWSPTPPMPGNYCMTASNQDLDCFCTAHPYDDKCACRYRPDSQSCFCVNNPTAASCKPGPDGTVTVTSNTDGTFTFTSLGGTTFVIKPRTSVDPNENITVTLTNNANCNEIKISYSKLIEFRDLDNNNKIDPTDVVVYVTLFSADSNGVATTGSSTIGGTTVSNVGNAGNNVDIQHYYSKNGISLFGDTTLNIPSNALETILSIKNYVSKSSGSKICISGAICVCSGCTISVDNVNQVISIVCGPSTTTVSYQKAYVGGNTIDVTVAISATADANMCYTFNACFDAYSVNTLLWDPYTQSSSTTSSTHHSAASTFNVSLFVIMIAVIAFFLRY